VGTRSPLPFRCRLFLLACKVEVSFLNFLNFLNPYYSISHNYNSKITAIRSYLTFHVHMNIYIFCTVVPFYQISFSFIPTDIIGVAETGSGKTASFVLPMLTYISKLPKMTIEIEQDGPYALILAPTRDLVQQIEKDVMKFAACMGFRTISLVGGVSFTFSPSFTISICLAPFLIITYSHNHLFSYSRSCSAPLASSLF
jgi:hypothetical protein